MDPISFAASIGALVETTAKVVGYLHDVRDGGKQRLRLSAEASALWMVLENVQDQLSTTGDGSSHLVKHYLEVLNKPDGVLVHCSDTVAALERKLRPRHGARGVIQNLRWPFEKDEVMTYLEIVHSMQSTINLAYAQASLKLLELVADDTEHTRAIVQEQELQSLLKWLSPIDFEDQHRLIYDQVYPGTGTWLLNEKAYKTWVEGHMSFLWCPGSQPGCGRTTMASVIINDLRKQQQAPTDAVLGVYLQSILGEQHPLRANSVIGTLLKQAILLLPRVPDSLWKWYRESARITKNPGYADLKFHFDSAVTQFNRLYLILDAVEVINPGSSRAVLVDLIRELPKNISLLITYQGEPVIAQDIAPLAHICDICSSRMSHSLYHCGNHTQGGFDICLTCYDNGRVRCPDTTHGPMKLMKNALKIPIEPPRSDLQRYVLGRIQNAEGLLSSSRVDAQLRAEITDRVLDRANSTFLYAKIYLDHLETLDTLRNIKDAILDFPQDINETYAQAFASINRHRPQISQLAKEVLKWVMSARRPLRTTELEHAVQIRHGANDMDFEDIVPAHRLVAICCGLVVVDHLSHVRIVHRTAQKYLDPIMDLLFPEADFEIAGSCLTYLSLSISMASSSGNPISISKLTTGNYPFSGYAAEFWAIHLGPSPPKPFLKTALSLLTSTTHMQPLGALYGLGNAPPESINAGIETGLRVASHFGFPLLVRSLLDRKEAPAIIDSMDLFGQTALWISVSEGHTEVVKLLLEAGASPNIADTYGTTPLLEAIKEDHLQALKLLLETRTTNVNQESRIVTRNVTALVFAASRGKVEVLKELLKANDVQVNRIVNGSTALTAAVKTGYLDCVEALINDMKCNIDSGDDNNQTALHHAVMKGNETILLSLIRHGASVDHVDLFGNTPIFSAFLENQLDMAQVLILYGADPLRTNKSGQTALHLAAAFEESEVIEALLAQERRPDVNAQDRIGWTPIHVAVWYNSLQSSSVLLKYGADPSIANSEQVNAYQLAKEYGRELILQAIDEQLSVETPSISENKGEVLSEVDDLGSKVAESMIGPI